MIYRYLQKGGLNGSQKIWDVGGSPGNTGMMSDADPVVSVLYLRLG